ncbi:hypothetical protein FNW02_27140 [Komarekiella sp. 'clone 1']|uniref:Uncharacterized protein n=1 Tax=Komarekiella delphini-convector SJRDD-AB1 TaxID=2593771 RepID=A0AA40T1W8_9NOST|nr:hypothetical protein [Komarekiella delphini-convector SJRDD-AB1]
MFTVDEYVINQKTGQVGKVVGYGHEIINNVYTVTLKVLVTETVGSPKRICLVEDNISAWNRCSIASESHLVVSNIEF